MTTGRIQSRSATWLIPLVIALLALALPAVGEAAGTGAISGTINGAGVGPLVEAEACAEGLTPGATEFSCAKTGVGGAYTVSGLVEGSYAVWLSPPRGTNFVSEYFGGAQARELATPVQVTAPATTSTISATLEKGATISGSVKAAATGLPVAKVEVCAFGTNGSGFGCGETNGFGGYEILGLSAGTYQVEFFAFESEQNLLSQSYPGLITVAARQEVVGVNAVLQTGGQISGTVRAAATGAPLKDVDVCLTEATETWPLACLTTPASGAYRFIGVWSGSFKVVFSPEASEVEEGEYWELKPDPFPTQWWNGQPSFAAATPIGVVAGATVSGIDGSLGPGPVAPAVVTPSSTPAPAPVVATPKPVKCAKGFKKKTAKGRTRCVKIKRHKPKRHHRKHRHAKPRGHAQTSR